MGVLSLGQDGFDLLVEADQLVIHDDVSSDSRYTDSVFRCASTVLQWSPEADGRSVATNPGVALNSFEI
jgi:hypothetical protein